MKRSFERVHKGQRTRKSIFRLDIGSVTFRLADGAYGVGVRSPIENSACSLAIFIAIVSSSRQAGR